MIAYLFCNFGDIGHIGYRYINYPHQEQIMYDEAMFMLFVDLIYFFSNLMFYILLLFKIYKSFHLTKIEIIFVIFVIILSIASFTYFCYGNIDHNMLNSKQSLDEYYIKLKWNIITWSSADAALNFTLFLLLIWKLYNINSTEGTQFSASAVTKTNLTNMDAYYMKSIWNAIIKHCVLFAPLLWIKNAFFISVFITCEIHGSPTVVYNYPTRAMENLCTVFVLWLALRVNNKKYMKLCRGFHQCCLRRCRKRKQTQPGLIRDARRSMMRDLSEDSEYNTIPVQRNSSYFGGKDVYVTKIGDGHSYDENVTRKDLRVHSLRTTNDSGSGSAINSRHSSYVGGQYVHVTNQGDGVQSSSDNIIVASVVDDSGVQSIKNKADKTPLI